MGSNSSTGVAGGILDQHLPAPPWESVDWDADPDWPWHTAASDSPDIDTIEEYAPHVGHAELFRESMTAGRARTRRTEAGHVPSRVFLRGGAAMTSSE